MGFTASTGEAFENHEVLSWQFSELKADSPSFSALAGAHEHPGQDAPPRLAARWDDPVFSRLEERGQTP